MYSLDDLRYLRSIVEEVIEEADQKKIALPAVVMAKRLFEA